MNPMRMRRSTSRRRHAAPRLPQGRRPPPAPASRSAFSYRRARADGRARQGRRRRRGRHARAQRVRAHRHATTRSRSSSSTSRWARARYTGLPTLVAEELDAAWSQVRVEGAPADASSTTTSLWGPAQGTGGSTAIANSFEQYRAGRRRRARDAGRRRGASVEGAGRRRSRSKEGVVTHASGKQATFGELADAAARQPVPADGQAQGSEGLRLHRQARRRAPTRAAKSNGTATFTQDVKLPGMLTARRRAPAALRREASRAFDCGGRDRRCPACATWSRSRTASRSSATSFWAAKKGRDALKVDWDDAARLQGLDRRRSSPSTSALATTPGKPRAQRRRCRQGARRRRQDARGRLRVSRTSRTRRWSR